MAQHLVESPLAVLGSCPPGQPSPGHQDQHRPNVCDVGDGLQGMVHQGILWTRAGWTEGLLGTPSVHNSPGPALQVPGSQRLAL